MFRRHFRTPASLLGVCSCSNNLWIDPAIENSTIRLYGWNSGFEHATFIDESLNSGLWMRIPSASLGIRQIERGMGGASISFGARGGRRQPAAVPGMEPDLPTELSRSGAIWVDSNGGLDAANLAAAKEHVTFWHTETQRVALLRSLCVWPGRVCLPTGKSRAKRSGTRRWIIPSR